MYSIIADGLLADQFTSAFIFLSLRCYILLNHVACEVSVQMRTSLSLCTGEGVVVVR